MIQRLVDVVAPVTVLFIIEHVVYLTSTLVRGEQLGNRGRPVEARRMHDAFAAIQLHRELLSVGEE